MNYFNTQYPYRAPGLYQMRGLGDVDPGAVNQLPPPPACPARWPWIALSVAAGLGVLYFLGKNFELARDNDELFWALKVRREGIYTD